MATRKKEEDKHPLVAYREQHGLTQQELADKLDVSRGLVSLIESGERSITPENAKDWEGKIGIPREKLCPEIFGRAAA